MTELMAIPATAMRLTHIAWQVTTLTRHLAQSLTIYHSGKFAVGFVVCITAARAASSRPTGTKRFNSSAQRLMTAAPRYGAVGKLVLCEH